MTITTFRKMAFRRWFVMALIFMMIPAFSIAAYAETGVNVAAHTQDEIRNYINQNGPKYVATSFAKEPDKTDDGYHMGDQGALSTETMQDGLKMLNEANIKDSVLKLRSIEALKDMADGQATKIYMPTDMTDLIGTLGVAGEALGIGDKTPIHSSPKPKAPHPADPCINKDTSPGGREAARTSANIIRDVSKHQ